jgi:hypothetical protein
LSDIEFVLSIVKNDNIIVKTVFVKKNISMYFLIDLDKNKNKKSAQLDYKMLFFSLKKDF